MKKFLLCCIVILCFALSVTAKGKFELDECSYLQKEESQSNAYITHAGHLCCLCWKGTYWNGDCSSTEKIRETQCEPCVYNNITKTYRDFGPHKENKCEVEQYCSAGAGLISVGGSASEKNRCECPVGFQKKEIFSNYHRCEEVIAEITTPTTIATVKTDEIDKVLDENSVVPPTATIENRTKKDEPDVAITPENHEKDQKIVDTGYPDPEINGEDQKIVVTVSPEVNFTPVPSTTAIYISNGDENQTAIVIASILGGCFILTLILLIKCGVLEEIRCGNFTQFHSFTPVKSCPPELGDVTDTQDPQGSRSRHDDTSSLTAHSQYGEVNKSVDINESNEGQSLLLQSTNNRSDDPGGEEEIVFGEIRVNIDDVEARRQQDVAQGVDSDTLSVVVEMPERNREPETQNNMAGPIDSGNRNGVVRESDFDLMQHSQTAPVSLTQQVDQRISPNHKKLRGYATEKIIDIINQPDLMLLGHYLIPNHVELDSIIEKYRKDGHVEVSQRVFIRGFEKKPNISLYELRDKAIEWKLGYLKDEFEKQIEQLERSIAQELCNLTGYFLDIAEVIMPD